MVKFNEVKRRRTLAEDIRAVPQSRTTVRLWWLGQAGFLLRWRELLCCIDPYLSEHLTAKYHGTRTPHERLMPAPVHADQLRGLRAVLCSHRHSDHMDPGTLPALAAGNPECLFIVPAAERDHAAAMGISEDRLRPANAGEIIELAPGASVTVLPSAHEELKTDDLGRHHFIGFVLDFGSTELAEVGGIRIYHSGDCVPYAGLDERLRELHPDAALLPVNGRDERRHRLGIIGNFTLDEAAALCLSAHIPLMIGHHFGMFPSNTVPREELLDAVSRLGPGVQCVLPEADRRYELRQTE